MKAVLIVAAGSVLAALGYFVFAPAPTEVPAPLAIHSPTPTPATPPPEKVTLRTSSDAVEIFRRAFWREPASEDHILHAERREWVSEMDGVRRWQWYLALKPSAELSRWLREENPFHLASASALPSVNEAPAWFPTSGLRDAEVQYAPDGGMVLIFDTPKNVFYATDAGHGFAAAQRETAAPKTVTKDPSLAPGNTGPPRALREQHVAR